MNYNGQIDYADWQNMPDYRQGWQNKHKSGIASLGRTFDVTTYIPGANKVSDFMHEGTQRGMTAANTYISPVVKTVNQGLDVIDPTAKWLKDNTVLGDVNRFVEEKPADALAIAAATYFTAGAASNALGGAGAAGSAAAPAASGGAGAAGGMAGAAGGAASGTAGISALGSAAITPAFESAAGSALTSSALSGAAATGYGGLGAAGTAAGTSLLTPAFASTGAAASEGGLLSSLKNTYGKVSKYKDYYDNVKTVADANRQPTDRQRYNAQAGAMAERILNNGQAQNDYRQRVANQLMINRFGAR